MIKTNKNLIVLAGPTAVGKTQTGINLALHFNSEIISCDSRQFYRELNIGTAKPDNEQLALVKHHFVGHLSIHDYYNAARYETDVLALLDDLFAVSEIAFMVGGSGLYIDSVCNGIDDFPDPDPELRSYLKGILRDEGVAGLRKMLFALDPLYYEKVDLNNPSRLLRALEVCLTTGKKYSEMRSESRKPRSFNVLKIALTMPRPKLFARIAARTDAMMEAGLPEEVRGLLPYRHLNALNTVGYRELFNYLDRNVTLERAVEDIKTNTRRYAKRQLTWFNRSGEYQWFGPEQTDQIIDYIKLNTK